MPTTLLLPPQIFRPSDIPEVDAQVRRNREGVGWGRALHILVDQLTLSQTRGLIMLAPALQIFRPSDISEVDAQVYLKGANIINPW